MSVKSLKQRALSNPQVKAEYDKLDATMPIQVGLHYSSMRKPVNLNCDSSRNAYRKLC